MPTMTALPTITGDALLQLRVLVDHGIQDFNDRAVGDSADVWHLPAHVPRQQSIHDSIRAMIATATEITAATFPYEYLEHLVSLVEHAIDGFDYTLDYSPAEIADLDPPLKDRTVLHETILSTVRSFR